MLKLGLFTGLLITLLVFVGGCVPAPEGGEGGFDWSLIIFLVLIFAVFYFLIIRPQRKRQKEHDNLVQELRKGDNVITSGGIHGVIETVSDEVVLMKIESGTIVRVEKNSVVRRREK